MFCLGHSVLGCWVLCRSQCIGVLGFVWVTVLSGVVFSADHSVDKLICFLQITLFEKVICFLPVTLFRG